MGDHAYKGTRATNLGDAGKDLQTERMANKQRWFTGVYLDVSMAGPVQLLVVS